MRPQKWRQEGGNNPCRRVEDALSSFPQGTGPVHRRPRGCWTGSPGSSYIFREAGGTVGPLCAGVQELLFQRVLFEDPHWGLPHLSLQDPALPSNPPKATGAPLVHSSYRERLGRLHPPQSWAPGNRMEETQVPRGRACRSHLEAPHPCRCSLVLRVLASLGAVLRQVSSLGSLRFLNLESLVTSGTISQPEVEGSVDSSVYVSN